MRRRVRRIFGRRTRTGRVQPQGYTPSGAIQALLSTLRLYEREGYLQADEVRPVIENLINNGTEGEAEFRQQASTLIDRGTERLDNRINRENQAGETKRQSRSRYVLQQQPQEAQEPRHVIQRRGHIDADPVAKEVPMAVQVDPIPGEEIPTATEVRVVRASPLLEVVRNIQSEM